MKLKKKSDTIILWDLHEVVFRKNWKALVSLLLGSTSSHSIFKKLPKELLSVCRVAFKAKRREKKKIISTADILYSAQEENNTALIDLIFKLSCAYRPIIPTVSIIKRLKKKGYVHHIGSNIPRPVFDQFKNLYPDIFSLFDYAHVVDVASRDAVIQKPDPTFFKTYLEHHNVSPEKILFIDDKKRNIRTARSIGIHTIHFKHATQLEKELQLRRIL